ncbi:hypothetical protein PM004_08290 [Clostridium paraputrificum]|uniref:hypothetical protein n=1 Tax=Clostridium TaxID=1485 RepID=UPI00232BA420|nr:MULTISPECIES: hypothetical protein [Clostridium]MDB2089335.1 hypothetical protein [Clostridium paraputrificum]MDB2097694.1 hypothetical protein [Clostridium paraputrificum]MDU1180058.1 hypothetical protein [Clostridium sp.]MDU1228113.1 hypothetical protein [Clostridium sp.]MDU3676170.1 hypothetical protein [Clostridium sp.]
MKIKKTDKKAYNNILTRQQKKLILLSTICEEDEELRKFLESFSSARGIRLRDIETLKQNSERLFNILKSPEARELLINSVSKEWRREIATRITNDKCELCGNEKAIHKSNLRNIKNNNLLLVGSSCIQKFKYIDFNTRGEDINTAIEIEAVDPKKWERMGEFYQIYGHGKDIFSKWQEEYKSFGVAFPFKFDKEFREICKRGRGFYDRYINGVLEIPKTVKSFENYIIDFKYFYNNKCKVYYDNNKHNRFLCSYSMGEYIKKVNRKVWSDIKNRECCEVKVEESKIFANKEFVKRFESEIEECFVPKNLYLDRILESDIKFFVQYANYTTKFKVEIPLKDFVMKYSHIFYGYPLCNFNNGIYFRLSRSLENIQLFLDRIESVLRFDKYYFKFNNDLYDRNEIQLYKRGIKKYAIIDLYEFLSEYTSILWLNDTDSRKFLSDKFKKLDWITFDERNKYKIGSISTNVMDSDDIKYESKEEYQRRLNNEKKEKIEIF